MHDPRVFRDQVELLREGMRRRQKLDELAPLIDRGVALEDHALDVVREEHGRGADPRRREDRRVREVEDDSHAAKAGVLEGDLIVSAGGKAIANADDLYEALGAAATSLSLGLVRGSEELTVEVALS